MTTDIEWEKWGARDPYFGVLTDPKFRAAALTDAAREEFFAMGRHHVDHVLHIIRCHLEGGFVPTRTLDFGCGVGRLLLPFARLGGEVVGVDISPSMLAEAKRNCDQAGLANVVLAPSDDTLSAVDGDFDLVHTCIVLQHIEIARGLRIFEQLVRRVRPGGGIGAIHITFGWDFHAANLGVPPPPPPPMEARSFISVVSATVQPWLTSPRRWSSGTLTFSKNTSLNAVPPVIWRRGRTSTPGACMSTTNPVRPRCLGRLGSVRQITSPTSA